MGGGQSQVRGWWVLLRRVGSYGMEAAVLLFGLPPGKRKEWRVAGVYLACHCGGWQLARCWMWAQEGGRGGGGVCAGGLVFNVSLPCFYTCMKTWRF